MKTKSTNNLKKIRECFKMSQNDLAKRIGKSKQAIWNYENNTSSLSFDTLTLIAKMFNCEIPEITGEREFDTQGSSLSLGKNAPSSVVLIKKYDVRASAGDGMLVTQEDVIGDISFTSDFLLKITTSQPDKLAFIEVKGDSMRPTFKDGDSILIDRNKRDIQTGGIFVLRVGELLKVKRLSYDPFNQVLKLVSDNKDSVGGERIFPDYQISLDGLSNVNVVGCVIWCGKSV